MYQSLVWIAVGLVVIWIFARVVLAVTSFFLHVLWIGALVFAIVWAAKKFL